MIVLAIETHLLTRTNRVSDGTVMMNADNFRRLLDYNGLVMQSAEVVAESDYHRTSAGLSFGSLHATLVHILVGELVWLARWEGSLPPERLKDARKAQRLAEHEIPSFEAFTELWCREQDRQMRFSSALTDEMVSATVVYDDQYGNPDEQPLCQLITHLVNHGTQFRAEAAVRLTQLGYAASVAGVEPMGLWRSLGTPSFVVLRLPDLRVTSVVGCVGVP